MLAGTVCFYDAFKRTLLELDIEEFDEMSTEQLFKRILELGAAKVVVKGFSNNHQNTPYESIIFSERS